MKNRIAGSLLIGALALSPGLASAEETDASIEQLIVNSAHSAADHAALAKYYREKAAAALASASSHETMARSYGGVKMAQKEKMESHCKKLAANDKASAAEYEALAKLHDADAKKTQ